MSKIRGIALLLCFAAIFFPATTMTATPYNQPAGNLSERGRGPEKGVTINWDEHVVRAVGIGVLPTNAHSIAQANAMARRFAVVEAYHKLTVGVERICVDGATTVGLYELESDSVKARVNALIKGAHVVEEQAMPDGVCRVTMEINLFGSNSVAGAIAEKMKPTELLSPPHPSNSFLDGTKSVLRTGLVIDTRGFDLEKALAPRIYDETGRLIYANQYVSSELVVRKGLVDYIGLSHRDEIKSGSSRAGAMPIRVKAIYLRDANSNIVISKVDADRILEANAQSGFLAKESVVVE